ncbi:MAG TPA: hypothetical protein VGL93_08265 [Streptosporangiaceae bacterium]|jgi:hypothetical protein
MRSPARSTYTYLTLVGVVLVLVFAARVDLFTPGQDPPRRQGGGATEPGLMGADGQPSPRRLNDMWATYGHAASCSQWSGADGMQAIRLTPDKIAWFFSDTFLGPVNPDGSRPLFGTSMIQNSMVVQTTEPDGDNRLTTVTGGGTCGKPTSAGPRALLPRPPETPRPWYWAADNAIVGHTLVKFYNRFHYGGPRYIPEGTVIARFPMDDLTAKRTPTVQHPPTTAIPSYTPNPGGSPILWGGAVLVDGGTTYVYGWATPDINVQDKRLYLARVPSRSLADFGAWSFYAGAGTWSTSQTRAQPLQPIGAPLSVSNGFTVAKIGGRYWLIQHEPDLFDPDIVAYPAATPWSSFDVRRRIHLFRAPEVGRDAAHDWRMIYEARLIPALSTRKRLVIGYSVNSAAVSTGCRNLVEHTDKIYRPRFITVPTSVFTTGRMDEGVSYDPREVSNAARQFYGQWHDTWSGSACPKLKRIVYIGAQPGMDGSVTLSWPSVGLDVWYRVYARDRTGAGWGPYRLVNRTFNPSVTLTGYKHGSTHQWKVVPVNVRNQAGPPISIRQKLP